MLKRRFFIMVWFFFIIIYFIFIFVSLNTDKDDESRPDQLQDFDLSDKGLLAEHDKNDNHKDCQKYREKCFSLYNKLLYPNLSLIIKPPCRQPPKEMLNDFTQNGEMPIKRYWYFDDAYSDSASNLGNKPKEVVGNHEINKWRNRIKNGMPLEYNDMNMKSSMFDNKDLIKDKKLAVIGTREVWIEALGLEAGASKVTTLEYTHKEYEDKKNLEWIHVNDYLKNAINNEVLEEFDNAASFSSIEHSGLGRYGDPLSPYGDIEAIKQIHCMLKPDGLLFLGIPISFDGSSYIEFNAHRIYGDKRLKLLFEGWTQVGKTYTEMNSFHQYVFVLKKNNICK